MQHFSDLQLFIDLNWNSHTWSKHLAVRILVNAYTSKFWKRLLFEGMGFLQNFGKVRGLEIPVLLEAPVNLNFEQLNFRSIQGGNPRKNLENYVHIATELHAVFYSRSKRNSCSCRLISWQSSDADGYLDFVDGWVTDNIVSARARPERMCSFCLRRLPIGGGCKLRRWWSWQCFGNLVRFVTQRNCATRRGSEDTICVLVRSRWPYSPILSFLVH